VVTGRFDLKLLFVIDHLGLGGAQRQMVDLACGLARRGHTVEFFVYYSQYDFFADRIRAAGIAIHRHRKGRGFSFSVIWKLIVLMREQRFDLVLSYLNNPNVYAELAKLIARGPILVVSERCSHHDDGSVVVAKFRRALHRAAQSLVTNSEAHATWLRSRWGLSRKVTAIYNGFDLDLFGPPRPPPLRLRDIRLLAVGRICAQKNLTTLIEGLRLFHIRNGYAPSVSWVGKRDVDADGNRYGDRVLATLDKYPEIKDNWQWLGEQRDIRTVFNEHHALVHPSRYEGLPNVVCEALATGMPVLISAVCDHSLLVADGQRGFVFDADSPASIASALQKLMNLDPREWKAFSKDARMFAESHLDLKRMILEYEMLFVSLVNRQ
jgi:glycosyltransferase involved in cell wall biosynthesis